MKSFFDGKKALVVINPISGKRTTKTQLFDITDLFSTQGLETTVYTTRCKGDATDIVQRRGGDFDIIVCRGGDGTFNEVVNGMMILEDRPLLGYIPAGSTNDLARTLCIPVNSNQEAIDIILNGQPLWNDIGSFNGGMHWCYTASYGAFCEISYETSQKLKNRLGRAAYFFQAPASLRNVAPIATRLKTAEGFEFEGDVIFCGISNSVSIAGTIKLPRSLVGLNDGRFELLLVRYPKTAGEFATSVKNLLTKNFTGDVMMIHTARAEFSFEGNVPWTIDGEYAGAHESVVIENIHNAVQIFRR